MKELKQIFMLMLVSVLSAGFASCGSDDDDSTGTATTPTTPSTETPTTPEVKDTREYVDLGLPSGTLWATCNIGAEKPEDYGLYFAWGETKGYTGDTSDGRSFDWASYKLCNGSDSKMTKYSRSTYHWDYLSLGTLPDQKTELDAEDDAATVNWGSEWQVPSSDQIEEVVNSSYTTTKRTTQNGVNGLLITSKANGNTIFFPASGYRHDSSLVKLGMACGFYWSRSLYPGEVSKYARILEWNVSLINQVLYEEIHWDVSDRFYGLPVRAVRVQK